VHYMESMTAKEEKSNYQDDLFDRVRIGLADRDFERISLYEWIYTHADGERFIKVTLDSRQVIEVNFNDEEITYQSPYDVLSGLEKFGE